MGISDTSVEFSAIAKVRNVFITAIAVICVVSVFFIAKSERSHQEGMLREFRQSGQNYAHTLSHDFSQGLEDKTVDGPTFLDSTMKSSPEIVAITAMYGPELKSQNDLGGTGVADTESFSATSGRQGSPYYAKITIRLKSPLEENHFWYFLLKTASGFLALAISFIAIVELFFRLYLIKPLTALVESLDRFSKGDLATTEVPQGNDELVRLLSKTNEIKTLVGKVVGELTTVTKGQLEAGSVTASEISIIHSQAQEQSKVLENSAESMALMDEMTRNTVSTAETLLDVIAQSASSTVQMSTSISDVRKAAESLAQTVDLSASSIEELASSITTVADGVNLLNDQIFKTTEELVTIDSSIKSVRDMAGKSNEITEKVTQFVNREGLSSVTSAIKGFDNIRQSVEEAVTNITNLSQQTEGIGSVIDIVSDLAEQTNLLSLNAAIIAAQAGEQGKSFAVIADEIRELAERTTTYLEEISEKIRSIQAQAVGAVTTINKGFNAVEEGVLLIGAVQVTLNNTAANTKEASKASKAISDAIAVSADSAGKISGAAKQMASMSREMATITREQSEATKHMLKEVTSMRDLALRVDLSMREQDEVSRMISSAAESARRMTEEMRDVTVNDAMHSSNMLNTIGALKDTSRRTVDALTRLQSSLGEATAGLSKAKEYLKHFNV